MAQIKHVDELPVKDILGFVSVFYGKTSSGKTTLIQDIMYKLRDMVYMAIVVSPSESQNQNFSQKEDGVDIGVNLPKPCIWPDLNMAKMQELILRQQALSTTCSYSKKLKHLEHVIEKFPNQRLSKILRDVDNYGFSHKKLIDTKKMILLRYIKNNKSALLAELTKQGIGEKNVLFQTIKGCDLNPNTLFVIDDGTEHLKDFVKTKLFKEIVTKSRHYNLTVLMCSHSDIEIPASCRNLIPNTFLMENNIANAYLSRAGAPVNKDVIKELKRYLPQVFKSGSYQKIIICPSGVYIYQASEHSCFICGDKAFNEYVNTISKKDDEIISDSNNKYYDLF